VYLEQKLFIRIIKISNNKTSGVLFISRPTNIAEEFEKQFTLFDKFLKRAGFNPVRLGVNNYTLDAPLRGVIELMKTCQGAIILGYPQ